MTNNQASLMGLPVELRLKIYGHVLEVEDRTLWYGPFGPQNYDFLSLMRKQLSDNIPDISSRSDVTGVHPLRNVSVQVANEFQQVFANHHESYSLVIDAGMPRIPAEIFTQIRILTLDMKTACEKLMVVIPHLRPNHSNPVPPSTELQIADCPELEILNIRWDLSWLDALSFHERTTIAALIARLSYFKRSFRASIFYSAHSEAENNLPIFEGHLLDDEDEGDFVAMVDNPLDIAFFAQKLDSVKWHRAYCSSPNSSRRRAIAGCHPNHDRAPLGWSENLVVPPGPSYFALPANMPARLAAPRPFENY